MARSDTAATWTVENGADLYDLDRWGDSYFSTNSRGHVTVQPRGDRGGSIDLVDLVKGLQDRDLGLPLLIRFDDILEDRLERLHAAFDRAIAHYGYAGRYQGVFPVKCNQQRHVVEQLVDSGQRWHFGLEAGSKPELMAVLALARPASTIVCNGYKDHAFLRLAMAGQQLGHRVFIVVEKPSELVPIAELAATLGLRPRLGLRLRLASVAAGHWQNTGGEKSKFGLTASQAQAAIETLKTLGYLDCVQMLHVHMGSQVADHAALGRSMDETAHLYRALVEAGAPIDTVDVGGGLAVDYEGRGAKSFCSMNYGVADYARVVVRAMQRVCREHGLAERGLEQGGFPGAVGADDGGHPALLKAHIDGEDRRFLAIGDGQPAQGERRRREVLGHRASGGCGEVGAAHFRSLH